MAALSSGARWSSRATSGPTRSRKRSSCALMSQRWLTRTQSSTYGPRLAWDPWAELERRPPHHLRPCAPCRRRRAASTPAGPTARPWSWSTRDGAGRSGRVALAHELVHDERGGGCPCPADAPPGWGVVARREEARVEATVAARLVPLDELARYVEAGSTSTRGDGVGRGRGV